MTPRDRAVAALRRQSADRVPCVPLIDLSYAAALASVPVSDSFHDPALHARTLEQTLQRHPHIDGLSINLILADDVILERQTASDGCLTKTIGGVTWKVPHNDVGSLANFEITAFDDPRLAQVDHLRPGICQTLQHLNPDTLANYLICVGVTGPFSQIVFLMGLDRVLMATVDEPEALDRAIQARLPLALDWIDEVAASKPAAIWIGEGLASANLIGPSAYQRFVLPYEKALAQHIRKHNIATILHICGTVEPILHLIPDSGCDALELDWPVPLDRALQAIGSRMAVKGNLNTTTLVQESPEKIYQLSHGLIQQAKDYPGFILSSGCCIGRDTPPQNIDAMAQAARDTANT